MSLLSLKNKFAGQTIALIGNGPSLTMEDLEFLQKNKIFSYGVNKIFVAYPNTTWRPTFYSTSDYAIMDSVIKSFNEYIPDYVFLPKSAQKYISNQIQNLSNEKVFVVNHVSRSSHDYKRAFSEDISEISYGGYTVLFFALQVIHYLGFKKVLLLGVDHNYSYAKVSATKECSPNGRLIVHQEGSNHFHKNYFERGAVVGDVYLDEATVSFQMASDIYTKNQKEIINCSRKTNLNLFPRINLEDVIS